MSYITEAVLWLDGAYSNKAVVQAVESPLPFDGTRGQSFRKLDEDAAGGSKWFVTKVYAAAFNHLPGGGDALEEWFNGLPLRQYDTATLMWTTESEHSGLVRRGFDE